MSVHKHPTNPKWWQVRCQPDGAKGKQQIKKAARGSRTPTAFPIIADTILDYLEYYSLDHLDTTNVTRSLRRWRLRAKRKKPWILCE